MGKRKSQYRRPFWLSLRSDENGCWNWPFAKDDFGYGHCYYDGRNIQAHRHAYQQIFGPIPEGMLVCHRCDNPSCCNPWHLFLGTYADNNHDTMAKGRWRGWSKKKEAAR